MKLKHILGITLLSSTIFASPASAIECATCVATTKAVGAKNLAATELVQASVTSGFAALTAQLTTMEIILAQMIGQSGDAVKSAIQTQMKHTVSLEEAKNRRDLLVEAERNRVENKNISDYGVSQAACENTFVAAIAPTVESESELYKKRLRNGINNYMNGNPPKPDGSGKPSDESVPGGWGAEKHRVKMQKEYCENYATQADVDQKLCPKVTAKKDGPDPNNFAALYANASLDEESAKALELGLANLVATPIVLPKGAANTDAGREAAQKLKHAQNLSTAAAGALGDKLSSQRRIDNLDDNTKKQLKKIADEVGVPISKDGVSQEELQRLMVKRYYNPTAIAGNAVNVNVSSEVLLKEIREISALNAHLSLEQLEVLRKINTSLGALLGAKAEEMKKEVLARK